MVVPCCSYHTGSTQPPLTNCNVIGGYIDGCS